MQKKVAVLTKCCLFTVLSSTLDLLDLSEPGERRNSKDRKSILTSRSDGQQNISNKKKMDETELIQVEVEQMGPNVRNQERVSLDSGENSTVLLIFELYLFQNAFMTWLRPTKFTDVMTNPLFLIYSVMFTHSITFNIYHSTSLFKSHKPIKTVMAILLHTLHDYNFHCSPWNLPRTCSTWATEGPKQFDVMTEIISKDIFRKQPITFVFSS